VIGEAAETGIPFGLVAVVAGALFALAVGWMVMRNVLLDGGGRR